MSLPSRWHRYAVGRAAVLVLRALVASACLLLLLASASAAQAQRAPDTVAGVDVATVESLKGWVQSGTDWAGKFGDSGEVLRDATKGFDLSARWKAQIDRVAKLSERSRNALPTKLAPHLFQAADVINAVAIPLIAGDGRGAMSGAVDLGATSAVSTAGTAGGEWLGAAIGGTVGSFVPVVGNVVGATVGGAIGGFAGGYLAGAGYESYLKGSVASAVDAGIAMLVDPDPLVEKMRANEAALYRQLSPELAEMITTSHSFGAGEMQLQDWGRLAATPAPDAGVVTPPESFQVSWDTDPGNWVPCTIAGGNVSCLDERDIAGGHMKSTSTGTVVGNVIELQSLTTMQQGGECPTTTRYVAHNTMVFEPGGRLTTSGGGTGEIIARSGPCTGGETSWSYTGSAKGTWRAN